MSLFTSLADRAPNGPLTARLPTVGVGLMSSGSRRYGPDPNADPISTDATGQCLRCHDLRCAKKRLTTTFKTASQYIKHMQNNHSKEFERRNQLMAAAETLNERTERSAHFGNEREMVYTALGAIANSRTDELFQDNEIEKRRKDIEMQEGIEREEDFGATEIQTYPTMRTVQGVEIVTSLRRPDSEEPETNRDGEPDDFEVTSVEEHPTAGTPLATTSRPEDILFFRTKNPFAPFETPFDWKVGSWLLKGNASNDMITTGGNSGILQQHGSSYRTTITSVYKLRERVDALEPDFGKDKWLSSSVRFWANKDKAKAKFYYRDMTTVLKHFFKQPAFRDHMVYKPRKEYNEKGVRVFSEIFTADWAWEKQVI